MDIEKLDLFSNSMVINITLEDTRTKYDLMIMMETARSMVFIWLVNPDDSLDH